MLGIVSDDAFLAELGHSITTPELNIHEGEAGIVKIIERGRGNKPETPEIIRSIISEEANEGSSHKELASLFNVSVPSVSAYKNGATSTASYNNPDPKLAATRSSVRDRIKNRAGKKLSIALSTLTRDEIESAKPIEKAQIARHMAAIVKDMEPEEKQDNRNVQVVIFAPQVRKEDDYEIIDVRANEL